MNKQQIKDWVENAIKRGYDRYDIEDILNDKEKYPNKLVFNILKEFDKQSDLKNGMSLSYFQKRAIKKQLKEARKRARATVLIMEKLGKNAKKLNREANKELAVEKEKLIVSIIGDIENDVYGLNSVFDIEGSAGREITRKDLEMMDIDTIADLLDQLLEKLDGEI